MKKTDISVHVITRMTLQNTPWGEAKHKGYLYEIPLHKLSRIGDICKYMQRELSVTAWGSQ